MSTPEVSHGVAWEVEIDSMCVIVFATSRARAQWQAVKSYWDAYGRRRGEWPRARAWRAERHDRSALRFHPDQRAFIEDYVRDYPTR